MRSTTLSLLSLLLALFLFSCSSGTGEQNPDGDKDGDKELVIPSTDGDVTEEDDENSQGKLSASLEEVNFGAVHLGDVTSKTMLLTNTGVESLSISLVRIREATTDEFSILSIMLDDNIAEIPFTLDPQQSVELALQYAPINAGADSGTMEIIGENFSGNLLEIPLRSEEKGNSALDVTHRLEFGYAGNFGEESTLPLIIYNSPNDEESNRTLQITKLELIEGSRNYHLDLDNCAASTLHPILIAPGKSHTCQVVFSPRDAGELAGSIQIETDANAGEANDAVAVTGRCAPPESVLAVVVTPRGEPVAGAELRLWDTDALISLTDSRGRAVMTPEEDGQVFVADGARAYLGVYSKQYKRVLPEDEITVFVIEPLPVAFKQAVASGQVSATDLAGAVLTFDSEDVILPAGEESRLYMGLGNPAAAPYDLPEGIELTQMIWFGPDGTTFANPAKLTLPNTQGLAPGEQINFYAFNDTTLEWEQAAVMQANDEGTLLETVEGGVLHFSPGGTGRGMGQMEEYTITGLVKDDLDQVLEGIAVRAVGARGRMLDESSNSVGSYLISGIPARFPAYSKITLMASRSGEFYDDTLTSIVVEAGEDPGVVLEAPPIILPNNVAMGSVRGMAMDTTGAPVSGAAVLVHPSIGWVLNAPDTDSDGDFQLSSIPSGPARIVVTHTGRKLIGELTGVIPENSEWVDDIVLEPWADQEMPILVSSFPSQQQVDVSALAKLRITFNEALNAASLSADLKLSLSGSTVPGVATLEEENTVIVFTSDTPFAKGHRYTFTLDAALSDLSGNTIGEDFTLEFRSITPSCSSTGCTTGSYIWDTEICGGEPKPQGTFCEDGPSACSDQDTCDNAGNCLPNHFDSNTACAFDLATEYGCPDGTGCGKDVKVHYKDRYCTGSGDACNGSETWGNWELADNCTAAEICVSGQTTCKASASHSSSSCYSDDLYWYDACGTRQEKKEECGTCGCSGTACTVNNQYSSACYNNDVYWYDCHGVRKTKKEECGSSGCSGSACWIPTPGFVSIAAGNFWMGSPNDDSPCPAGYPPGDCTAELGRYDGEKLHEVTLTYDFELMAHEITQGEWVSLMTWNPSYFTSCGSDCPVENVTWYDILAYANELSSDAGLTPCYVFSSVECENSSTHGSDYMACMNATKGGIDSATVSLAGGATKSPDCAGYRLPTEAEWEYAIRVGSEYTAFYTSAGNNGVITQTERYFLDPNLDQIGWYGGNSGVSYAGGWNCSSWHPGSSTCGTHPVGGKEANAWGLYDMSGNVYEWVWDWYQEPYENDVATDPVGLSTGSDRVVRGGSWGYYAQICRSANRHSYSPDLRYKIVGARLCRSSP